MGVRALFLVLMVWAVTPAIAAEQKEFPLREDSGLTKTESLLSAGQFSAALETAADVLKRHPDNADAYTYRGYAYYHLGETTHAVKNFRMALKLNPVHLGANKYLADIYLDAGNVSQALEQLQVIRMTCGHTDCEERAALERKIDQHKRSGTDGKQDKEQDKER